MLTYLIIGAAAQIAWTFSVTFIFKWVTVKDTIEVISPKNLIANPSLIGWIALNILVWPLAVIINVLAIVAVGKLEEEEL